MKANYIEFYFDCSSPWTYLAFAEIVSLSQRHELDIDWKPVLVGGVLIPLIKTCMSLEKNLIL